MANYCTTFEIHDTECLVLRLKETKKGLALDTFFSVELPDVKEDDLEIKAARKGEALKSALKKKKFKPGDSILVIPKHFVTVRHAFLPSVEAAELDRMARFEAEKHIPFNVERHVVSHAVMNKKGSIGSDVLVAAADSPVVEEPLKVLVKAGVHPMKATVSSVGLYNMFRYLNREIPKDSTLAILHVGALTVEMVIISKGMLIFTRSTSNGIHRLISDLEEMPDSSTVLNMKNLHNLDIGNPERFFGGDGEDLFGPSGEGGESEETEQNDSLVINPEKKAKEEAAAVGKWKDKLIQSIRQTYDFSRREFECPSIDTVYLTGEGARIQNMEEWLAEVLDSGVETLDIKNIGNVENMPESYVSALGTALELFYEDAVRLNLLPESYIRTRESRARRQEFTSLGVMILGVIILGVLYYQAYSSNQQKLTRWYKKQNTNLKPAVMRLQDMQKKTVIISDYVMDEKNALAILSELSSYDYMPRRVSITDFQYTKGQGVELDGFAMTIEDLNRFIGDLEESGFFTEINIKQRPWKGLPNNRGKVLNYSLICRFEGEE